MSTSAAQRGAALRAAAPAQLRRGSASSAAGLPVPSAGAGRSPALGCTLTVSALSRRSARRSGVCVRAVAAPARPDTTSWNNAARTARLTHLEEQAMEALRLAVGNFKSVAFPCALIAGDVVLLHLLHRLGYLQSGKVKVIFIDTLHLFPETLAFLARLEAAYGFRAATFRAADCADRAAYDAKHGADLWQRDIEEYDRICKVEPFQRALRTLGVDAMVNGRRRDHGAERAHLELWEDKGGPSVSVQPLAYWEFRDCFSYLEAHGVEAHPLHAAGYPSIGDAHSTVPVPREKWFEYAGERSGRFQGLVTKEGKPKTECGIHVDGSTRSFERDLWEAGSGVRELTRADAEAGPAAWAGPGEDALLVVYAPWCPFCQRMEAEYTRLAAGVAGAGGVRLAKLRGDTVRDYVRDQLATASFPTLLAYKRGSAAGGFVKYGSEERSAEAILAWANGVFGTSRALKG